MPDPGVVICIAGVTDKGGASDLSFADADWRLAILESPMDTCGSSTSGTIRDPSADKDLQYRQLK